MSASIARIVTPSKYRATCDECGWKGLTFMSFERADDQANLHDQLMHPEPAGSGSDS